MGTVKDINLNQKGSLPLLQLVVSKLKALNLEYFIEDEKYYQNMSTSSNSQAFPIEDTPAVQNYTENGENRTSFTLPLYFTQISKLNKQCVSVYSVLFFFAAVGNLLVLYSVFPRRNLRKTRISLLITNLCVADLIVTFFLMPTEIFWRITIAWKGGEVLCKLSQFVRAFGLYLSSNVVICISIDRYFAIVHPLKLGAAVWRVKFTLVGAWILSMVLAGPQMFVYHVAQHPIYPEFHQCVTKAFLKTEPYNELVYNIGSVSALYFIPLVVVSYTYSMILLKLYRKSREQRVASIEEGKLQPTTTAHGSFCHSNIRTFYRKLSNSSGSNDSKKNRIILRCSENQRSTLNRARSRTLKLTLLILLTFIVCWTPYVTITLWYMMDRTGASQVDERLQEALFIMTVANSVINPFIYGAVGRKQRRRRKFSTPFLSVSVAKPNLTNSPFNGVALLKMKREAEFTIQDNTKGLGGHSTHQIYEHTSEGIHIVKLRKKTNFDTVLGFNPGIKRGRLGRKNNDFIISERITI